LTLILPIGGLGWKTQAGVKSPAGQEKPPVLELFAVGCAASLRRG